MKNILVLLSALLVLTATSASAAGVNLRWDSCFADGGVLNKTFACSGCTGTKAMSGSFVMNTDLPSVSGLEIVVDLTADAASLPPWWEFKNPGTCRQTSLSMATNQAGTNCPDWAELGATGGIGAYMIGVRGPATARVVAASAVPGDALKDLFGATEYYAFSLHIGNQKTSGTGACAGCLTPVCIVFNSIRVTTPVAANNRFIAGAANGIDSNVCTWQGGGNPPPPCSNCPPSTGGCPAAVPTRNETWGALKGMYH